MRTLIFTLTGRSRRGVSFYLIDIWQGHWPLFTEQRVRLGGLTGDVVVVGERSGFIKRQKKRRFTR